MKLGTSVKCKGYLKKVKTHHIVPCFEDLENDQYYLHFGGKIIDEDFSQTIMEFKPLDFEGIIVQIKDVATERYFYLGENEWSGKEYMSIQGDKCVKCYRVYFRLGGSRLVPINECELNNI